MAEDGVVVTRAGTLANRANLSPGFIDGLQAIYGGTRLAAQELDGQVVEGLEGACRGRSVVCRWCGAQHWPVVQPRARL
jgi:phage terminase large subunit-like protein